MEIKQYGVRLFDNKSGAAAFSPSLDSPWGSVQTAYVISKNVCLVTTSRHGGLSVSEKFAEEVLSKEALSYAIHGRKAYWFEEDCCCLIPFYERQDWLSLFVEGKVFGHYTEEELSNAISRYYPEYIDSRNSLSNK